MDRYEASIQIQAAAERVYAYVSDFTRHSEWASNDLQVTKDGDGPTEVGTTFSTTAKQFGTQREHSTITEMDPGRAFAWTSTGALGLAQHRFTMSPADGGTAVTKTAQIVEPKFLAKVMRRKIARDAPAALQVDMDRIKATLEAGTRP
jgi:uncharacterized membrane protein